MSVMTLAITDLRLDGGTQSRAAIDDKVVQDYADAVTAGAELPPVVAFHDGNAYWLADGFHRARAYLKAGRSPIPVDVRQGSQRDAFLFSVGANADHGLRRTNKDKAKAVRTLLNDAEWAKKKGFSEIEKILRNSGAQ